MIDVRAAVYAGVAAGIVSTLAQIALWLIFSDAFPAILFRDARLTAAIGRLFAVAEAYPQLRATENFQQLQAQLTEVEQQIAIARQVYNDTVLTYDNALETVPTNVVAAIFGFEQRPYFELDEPAAREAPQVRF